MAITGIPIFKDGEIPPAAKLNQLGDAITTKFSGAVSPSDMTWPFVVEGNIDFDRTYGIIGLRTFWNIINADEYDSLDDAVTAAEDAGGTCILIPPDTTITADGVDIDTSGIVIVGCGKTSILKLTSGSTSGYLLRTGAGSLTDIAIENLTMDGQSTGSAQAGIIVRRVDSFQMRNVWVKNFTGVGVTLTNDGTDGNACTDASLTKMRFTGGSTTHLHVIDCDGLQIDGFKSTSAPAVAILMEPAASAGLIKRIMLTNVEIETPTGIGISILGFSGTPSANWSYIWLVQCHVTDAAADAFNIGEASKILKYVSVVGCTAPEATGDAFVMNMNIGEMKGCSGYSPGVRGLDLVDSDTVTVASCDFKNAGTYGVDLDDTTDAHVVFNNLSGASTAAFLATNATTPIIRNNQGAIGVGGGTSDGSADARTTTGTFTFSFTIPANAVRIDDIIQVIAATNHSSGTATFRLEYGGVAGPSVTAVAVNGYITFNVLINALTGANSTQGTAIFVQEGGTNNTTIRVNSTVDWTTDTALTFELTAISAGTMTLQDIGVAILGAV